MQIGSDLYRVPALVLLAALVAVFGTMWFRKRGVQPTTRLLREEVPAQRRQLLWLVGWMFAAIHLEMGVLGLGQSGLWLVLSRASVQLAVLMFLGSLAPQNFSRRPPILYVVAFGAPLIFFSTAVSLDPAPGAGVRIFLLLCCAAEIFVAGRWSLERNLVPEWASLLFVALVGAGGVWLTVRQQYGAVLGLVHSGVLLMTAFLFAAAFRRLTAGVILTVGGLVGWAMPVLLAPLASRSDLPVLMLRAVSLVQVIAAVGMIVLVLEDEVASNLAGQQRDRRARQEMEKYTELYLESLPFEDHAGQYDRVCETIVAISRFARAVITARSAEGHFRLAGKAGVDEAVMAVVNAVAHRSTDETLKEIRAKRYSKPEIGHLAALDMRGLLRPGEELPEYFQQVHAIAIHARDGRLMGSLLLAGLRDPDEPLQTEDVLPLELLVARLGAAREHEALLRQLMQAERLAGLGQLAGGVAHELNNPLTVVTGYAELLGDSDDAAAREQAGVILGEARRMKLIIESLMRFRRASTGGRMPINVGQLLEDIDKLMRHDVEAAGIALEVRIEPGMQPVDCDGAQLRQVFVQVIKNAASAMRDLGEGDERKITIEAVPLSRGVQVAVLDTGPGFPEPSRAFDPFFTTRHPGEGAGLGLSICYSIVREHGGEIAAVNLRPRGGAVVIELPVETVECTEAVDMRQSTGAAAMRGSDPVSAH
ncbi:MAG TPA: ATP-binding protein [Acidobacteriaceae bacterium]|jgi:signal transduction histidine kinase|nr:ATP-binding protein [Acidobacteriaceae bacterium]